MNTYKRDVKCYVQIKLRNDVWVKKESKNEGKRNRAIEREARTGKG